MPNLLIRDITEPTKKQLAIRAAQNGRSQQAEALAILEETLSPNPATWVSSLIGTAKDVGGIELPEPKRHSPRVTGAML